jgi:hypothetical protein
VKQLKLTAKWGSEGFYERLNFKRDGETRDDPFTGTTHTNMSKGIDEESEIKKPHPKDTLGVKRADMPQVHKDHYPELMQYLKNHGARISQSEVPATSLKAVQDEFSDEGVAKMMSKKGGNNGTTRKKPLLVSADNYIIDGHHRWLASYNLGETVPIFKFSIPVKKLLQLVRDFRHTTYKDIYNEQKQLSMMEQACLDGGHSLDDLNEIRVTKNLNNDDSVMGRMPAILKSIQEGNWNKIGSKGDFDIWIQNDFDHQGGRIVLTNRDLTMMVSSLLLKGELYGAQVVGMSWTHPKFRRKGYSTILYQSLLDHGYNIRSDGEQTRGSKMVWNKLYPKYKTLLYRENKLLGQVRDDQTFAKAYRRAGQSDGYYLVMQSPSGKVMENMSITGTARSQSDRNKKLSPGSEAWFRHWFSRPYMKREQVEQLKQEAVSHIKGARNEKATNRRRPNRNLRTDERRSKRRC